MSNIQRIGHYRLGKNLGIGSFGKVRCACTPGFGGRPRATGPCAARAARAHARAGAHGRLSCPHPAPARRRSRAPDACAPAAQWRSTS